MSYLEDLRQEAERSRAEKAARQALEEQREAIYREKICPRLLMIHQFLFDISAQMEELSQRIEASFEFPGIGRLSLTQDRYLLNIDSSERPSEITLTIHCGTPEERRYEVEPEKEAELRLLLNAHHIKFTMWPERLPRGRRVVVCESRMGAACRIRFLADIQNASINIELLNFQRPGEEFLRIGMDVDINTTWLDNLAGFLLQKRETLLPRPEPRQLSENERVALFRKLEEAIARQTVDDPPSAPAPPKRNGLFERVRGSLSSFLRRD